MTKRRKRCVLRTNKNAGNVEYNIAFFNAMNGVNAGESAGSSDGGGMGESLDKDYTTDDFLDMANSIDDVLCFADGTCVNGVAVNDKRFVDEVGEEHKISDDTKLHRARKEML